MHRQVQTARQDREVVQLEIDRSSNNRLDRVRKADGGRKLAGKSSVENMSMCGTVEDSVSGMLRKPSRLGTTIDKRTPTIF